MTAEQALARAQAMDPAATQFVIRLWDGFDNEWMDVTKPLSPDEAMKDWNMRTDEGKRATKYSDIDYYAIHPATVRMVFSEQGRKDLKL